MKRHPKLPTMFSSMDAFLLSWGDAIWDDICDTYRLHEIVLINEAIHGKIKSLELCTHADCADAYKKRKLRAIVKNVYLWQTPKNAVIQLYGGQRIVGFMLI